MSSVLSTLHGGGEGQNAERRKFSKTCDQGCRWSFTRAQSMGGKFQFIAWISFGTLILAQMHL